MRSLFRRHVDAGWRHRLAGGLLVFAWLLLGWTLSGEWAGRDVEAVRDVVQSQLHAMASDDARTAFDLADPAVRERYADAEHFLAALRTEYPMIDRPASIAFLQPRTQGPIAFQRVRMIDRDGSPWLVTYLLHRQRNREWRITARLVVPDEPRLMA